MACSFRFLRQLHQKYISFKPNKLLRKTLQSYTPTHQSVKKEIKNMQQFYNNKFFEEKKTVQEKGHENFF